MAQGHSDTQPNLFQAMLGYLGLLFRLEKKVLGLIFSYSLAIGLFSLIVPLTVQELVNTDRKSTRLNSSHMSESRMPSSA